MSKKYFTKYIQVEGEIKEGDRIQYEGKLGVASHIAYVLKLDGESENTILDHQQQIDSRKKVKLFLCSRDIQWQDKFFFKDNPQEFTYNQTSDNVPYWVNCDGMLYAKDQCYKVIGEVSPDATWVKEGDEFDEYEIIRTYSERDYDPEAEEADWYTYQIKGSDPDPRCPDSWHFNPIKIKCKCCNKFA